jgi:kynurenine/2-aminoadipate aminotransferase
MRYAPTIFSAEGRAAREVLPAIILRSRSPSLSRLSPPTSKRLFSKSCVLERIKDYDYFLSPMAKRRKPSPIRALQPLVGIKGMISLGGGMPNTEYFPIKAVDVHLKDGSTIAIKGSDMTTALQYSPSYGLPELVEWLKGYQEKEHRPPYGSREEWHVCVTNGSSDANSKAFDMLIQEGDYVFTENPTYSGALAGLRPLGCHLIGVETDGDGLKPSALKECLANWPATRRRPKVLYIIPTGQNPSGSTLARERREEIYEIASRHNLLILEDDPYYHLQFPRSSNTSENSKSTAKLPSFLSMDKDGRVIRFDSFSKIISSGFRIGWATGPAFLIERLQLHQQASTLHVSGLSQQVLLKLLKKWGDDGLQHHIRTVQEGYRKRRDDFLELADKHLRGLAEWHAPSAGMFVWFKVNGIRSTEQLIKERAVKQKVLLVPGVAFTPNEEPSPYVRASFSTASKDEMDEALKRFAELLREERASLA